MNVRQDDSDVTYGETSDNWPHGRGSDVRHILLKIVHWEAGMIWIFNAEEEGAGNKHRDIITRKTNKILDVYLAIQF